MTHTREQPGDDTMNVYTIWLRNIETGETAPSLVCRVDDEAAAHAYAEDAIAKLSMQQALTVDKIVARKG